MTIAVTSIFTFLLGIILDFAKIITLFWVFYKTRKLSAIGYMIYLLIARISMTLFMNNIIKNSVFIMLLGETSSERTANFLYLMRTFFSGVETLVFIWLLLSLVRRTI